MQKRIQIVIFFDKCKATQQVGSDKGLIAV